MAEELTEAQIQQMLTDNEKDTAPQYVFPLTDAGERLMDWLVNDEGRFNLGLPQIDSMLRGIGRGELCYVIGRPHSGKTQLVLQALVNNPNKRILFFTPDETDVLILTKLISINRGINAEELERRLKSRDPEAMKMVREVASDVFKNLFVVDRPLTFGQMSTALREAEAYWRAPGDLVVGDFLELFPGSGDYEGVVQLSQQFKSWLKVENIAGMILHQNSRSGGERGKAAGMDGMRYGGESEATYVLEVYRKREQFDVNKPAELDEYNKHMRTVTVNVAKNKRPPSRTGEVDFDLDPATGTIKPLSALAPTTPFNAVVDQPSLPDDDEEPF